MRKRTLILITSIYLGISLVAIGFSQADSSSNKRIKLSFATIFVPMDFETISLVGKDANISKFCNSDFTLSSEIGKHAGKPSNPLNSGYSERRITIDGKKAVLVRDQTSEEYFSALYFKSVGRYSDPASVVIRYNSLSKRQSAERMLRSLKFHKNKN